MKELAFEIALRFPLVWLVRVVAFAVSPLRRRMLGRISSQVRVDRKEAYLENAYTPAPIHFRLLFDSKAPVKMKMERVVLNLCLEGVPCHIFQWSREDRCSEDLGTVDDLPEKGYANIVFRYTPPVYMYYTTRRIYIRGYVRFRCRLGDICKLVNEHVDLNDEQKGRAIANIRERYRVFFEEMGLPHPFGT